MEGVMRIVDGERRTINKDSAAYKSELDPNIDEPVRVLDPDEAIFVTQDNHIEGSYNEIDDHEKGGATWLIAGPVNKKLSEAISDLVKSGEVTITTAYHPTGVKKFLHFSEDSKKTQTIVQTLKDIKDGSQYSARKTTITKA